MEHAGVQLGSDGWRHAGDRAASVGAGRLHPAELGKPAGHRQRCVDAGRLRHVRLQRAAVDPRLPGGGGYPLTFRDVKPAKVQQIDNWLTFADDVGGAFNRFNGVDVTVNARLRDVTIQGGTSTGNVVEDSCGVVTQHPEYYIFSAWGGTGAFLDTFLGGVGQWPQQFCHRESGWKTNIKGLASYTVPKIDVLISGTFNSLPYPGNEFPSVQSQSLGGQVLGLFLGDSGRGQHQPWPAALERHSHPVPEHRRARRVVRRSPEFRRSSVRQDPQVRQHQDDDQLRRLQPVQLEHDGGVPGVYSAPTTPGATPRSTYLDPLSIMSARFFKISAQFDF